MILYSSRQNSTGKLQCLKSNSWGRLQHTADCVQNQIQKHLNSRNKFFQGIVKGLIVNSLTMIRQSHVSESGDGYMTLGVNLPGNHTDPSDDRD